MNFDLIPNSKTFIVTIARNKTRFDATMEHLKENGMEPTVFTGIDGEIAGLGTRWDFDFADPILDSEADKSRWIGCYLSHYFVWKTCSYQPHDAFVILEDDVRLIDGWKVHLAQAMQDIEPEWDILFLGSCCTEGHSKTQIHDRLWKVEYANCTHAYAVRAKALPVLLEKLQRVHCKIDIAIALDAMPHLKCFAVLPRLCDQFGMELHP